MRKYAATIVAYTVALFLAAILAAATIGAVIEHALGLSMDISCSLARIVVATAILVVFRKLFCFRRSFSGIYYVMPLMFAAWNVTNCLIRGGSFVGVGGLPQAVVLGLGPGIFEEVIFRGFLIGKLREAGKGMMSTLVISAAVFGVVHMTNVIGSGIVQAVVQTSYSVVVGLVFGAVYIASRDIVSVVLFHAATDICYRAFAGDAETSLLTLALFLVLLVLEASWGVRLVRRAERAEGERAERDTEGSIRACPQDFY